MKGSHRSPTAVQPLPFISNEYRFAWVVVLIALLIDCCWLSISGCSVRVEGIVKILKAAGLIACIIAGLHTVSRIPRYEALSEKLRYRDVANTAKWMLVLLCFVPSIAVLSYLCGTIKAPLIDDSLLRFDNAIGFDWLATYRWVHAHTLVKQVFDLAYRSISWQFVAIPAILGLGRRQQDLSDFVMNLMLSSVLVLLISTAFPATSAFLRYAITDPNTVSTISDFNLLRSGTLRVFNLDEMQGLVTMPSFHTTLAILFAYALRRVPVLFPVAIVLNVLLIVSTPTQGGHYVADLFGGALLSVVTIVLARKWSSAIQSRAFAPDPGRSLVR